MPSVRVETGGQTLVLLAATAVVGGAAASLFTDSALSVPVVYPYVLGADTTLFYNDAVTAQLQITAETAAGQYLGAFPFQAYPGMSARIAPRITQALLEAAAADAGVAGIHGYLAHAFDPALGSTAFALTPGGTVFTTRIVVPATVSCTNLILAVQTAGATLTASQCIAGLYGPTGTLIAPTGDQSGVWNSTGVKVMPLTGGPFTLTPGYYTVAYYYNGTTGPTLVAAAIQATGSVNAGIAAANSRFGTADTGRTTTLAATLGAVSASVRSIWAALS
jgi:hypothetical protein